MIRVREVEEGVFEVQVKERGGSSNHRVTVAPDYLVRIAGEGADGARVVEKSFEFLLAREPKESILRSFDLKVIQRYFPEYESAIGRLL
ncbi:MAG: hypothetical protein HUU16_01955 [Candidatus Omnitrophica bacterium]|nr:hypothetical protein [bacterium]NUN94913.1 hypothetical protein [Candidatus Omnitrophota bacterium]